MKTWILLAVIPASALGAVAALKLNDAGEFRALAFHAPRDCRAVRGVPGPEDVAIDDAGGLAFISSWDRRAAGAQGAIYRYSFAAGEPSLAPLPTTLAGEFHPHGMSLYKNADDDKTYLFVVNHRRDGDSVEIFTYESERLVHRRSVADPSIRNGNAVLATGAAAFYMTLDHRSTSKLGQRFEEYLGLKAGSVVHFDGDRFRHVVEGVAFANGINRSRDGKTIYVASMLDQKILVYDKDASSAMLRFSREIPVGSAPDNIQIDADGDLLVGAHPKLLTLSLHRDDARHRAPSQILRIRPGRGAARIDELYLDDGAQISGASVGARYANLLVIGAVYDDHFLICVL